MIVALLLMLALPTQSQAPVHHPRHRGVVTIPRLIFLPNIDQFYPVKSRARDEQGVTLLRCTLEITGLLSGCVVRTSSGFAALDEAAFRIAELARYQPMLVDGKAVAEPVILPVRWVMAD